MPIYVPLVKMCQLEEPEDMNPKPRVYVQGIPVGTTELDLKNLFSQVGETYYWSVVPPKKAGQVTTYGFVSFETIEDAQVAIDTFDESQYKGKELKVSFSKDTKQDFGIADEDDEDEYYDKLYEEDISDSAPDEDILLADAVSKGSGIDYLAKNTCTELNDGIIKMNGHTLPGKTTRAAFSDAVRGMMLADLPVKPFPDEAVFNICTTEIVSPNCFYAQLLSQDTVASLHELTTQLNDTYNEHMAAFTPKKNEICVAKFDEDQAWYRASVVSYNTNGIAKVFFVDYGNKADVGTENIRCINESLLNFPRYAMKFSIHGIKETSAEMTSLMTSLLLYKPATVTCVCTEGDTMKCDVVSDGGEQLSTALSAITPVKVDMDSTEEFTKAVQPVQNLTVEKVSECDGVLQVRVFKDDDEVCSAPQQFTPEDESDSVDTKEIIETSESEKKDSDNSKHYSISCKDSTTNKSSDNGEVSIHMMPQEDAKSENLCEDKPVVQTTSIYVKRSAEISQEITSTIHEITETDDSATVSEGLEDTIIEIPQERNFPPDEKPGTVECVVVTTGHENQKKNEDDQRIRNVDLPEPKVYSDKVEKISSELCFEETADAGNAITTNVDKLIETKAVDDEKSIISALPSEVHPLEAADMKIDISILPDKVTNLLITHIVSPYLIYGVSTEESVLTKFDEMQKKITESCSLHEPDALRMKAGVLCVTKDTNSKWQRGIVTQVSEKDCSVFFLDTGFTVTVPRDSLRPLGKEFNSLPAQAIPIKLMTVKPVNDEKTWSRDAIDYLRGIMVGQPVRAKLEYREGVVTNVKLKLHPGNERIDKLFEDGGYAQVYQPVIPQGVVEGELLKKDVDDEKVFVPLEAITQVIKIEKIPVGSSFEGIITCVVSPSLFYARIYDDVKLSRVDNMAEELESLYGERPICSETFVKGQLCAALHKDNEWYRAYVIDTHPKTEKYIVWMVDYGIRVFLARDRLWPLPEDMKVFPAQALTMQLHHIVPTKKNQMHLKAAVLKFKALTLSKLMNIEVKKLHGFVHRVVMHDASSGVDVADVLVRYGLTNCLFNDKVPGHAPITSNKPRVDLMSYEIENPFRNSIQKGYIDKKVSYNHDEEERLSCGKSYSSVYRFEGTAEEYPFDRMGDRHARRPISASNDPYRYARMDGYEHGRSYEVQCPSCNALFPMYDDGMDSYVGRRWRYSPHPDDRYHEGGYQGYRSTPEESNRHDDGYVIYHDSPRHRKDRNKPPRYAYVDKVKSDTHQNGNPGEEINAVNAGKYVKSRVELLSGNDQKDTRTHYQNEVSCTDSTVVTQIPNESRKKATARGRGSGRGRSRGRGRGR